VAAKVLTTTIVGKQFKDDQAGAIAEFWRIMKAAPGGRKGDPKDYIDIASVERTTMGWEVEYVAEVKEEIPKCQNVLKSANLAQPEPVQAPKDDGHEREIPVSAILITGDNPRTTFNDVELKALADDIERNKLINAITVRPKGTQRYELIAGERRLRAHKLLGRSTIRAKVIDANDEQSFEIMAGENLYHVHLNSVEEAHLFKRMMTVGKLSAAELAGRLGKSPDSIRLRLRLIDAPAYLRDLITSRLVSPSAAADILADKNSPYLDDILRHVKEELKDIDEGDEIPRVRIRELIHAIADPDGELHEEPWKQGDTSSDEAIALLRGEASLITHRPAEPEPTAFYGTLLTEDQKQEIAEDPFPEPAELPWLKQPVVISDKECDGCGMYIPEFGECGQKCQTNEDCEKFYEDKEPVVESSTEDQDEVVPEEDETEVELTPERTKSVKFTVNSGTLSYNAKLFGSSNGDIQMESGPKEAPRYEDLSAVVAEAIGLEEGDTVPICVVIHKAEIIIRRRGSF
jgi:ParB/RepB/Spo0J family partition protein